MQIQMLAISLISLLATFALWSFATGPEPPQAALSTNLYSCPEEPVFCIGDIRSVTCSPEDSINPCKMTEVPSSMCTSHGEKEEEWRTHFSREKVPKSQKEAFQIADNLAENCASSILGNEWPYYNLHATTVSASHRHKCEMQSWQLMLFWLQGARQRVKSAYDKAGPLAGANALSIEIGTTIIPRFRSDFCASVRGPMLNELAGFRLFRGATNCDGFGSLLSYVAAGILPGATYSETKNHVLLSIQATGSAVPPSSKDGASISRLIHIDPMSNLCPWVESPELAQALGSDLLDKSHRPGPIFRNEPPIHSYYQKDSGGIRPTQSPQALPFLEAVCQAQDFEGDDFPNFSTKHRIDMNIDNPSLTLFLKARGKHLVYKGGGTETVNHSHIRESYETVREFSCRKSRSNRRQYTASAWVCGITTTLLERFAQNTPICGEWKPEQG